MKLQLRIMRSSCFLAGATVLFCAACLHAQPRKSGEGTERLVLERNWGDKEFADELKQFQAIRRAEQPMPENKAILDRGAQWYAYRLTHSEFLSPKAGAKSIHDLCKEAVDQIVDPRPAAGRPARRF